MNQFNTFIEKKRECVCVCVCVCVCANMNQMKSFTPGGTEIADFPPAVTICFNESVWEQVACREVKMIKHNARKKSTAELSDF